MKRLFTIIATHTTAVLLGFSIALFAAQFNRPRVVLDETAVPYSIHVSTTEDTSQPPDFVPLGEILNLDIATKDGTVIPFSRISVLKSKSSKTKTDA